MSFYDDASWLLIPSGIKEDVVFAQKPTSGLGDLTFTRASDATYTDSTGVVRRSPYNLVQRSEMFSNNIWSQLNTTIGIDATLAPNGTLTADKIVADTTNGVHNVNQLLVFEASRTYTASLYAKKGEYSGLRINVISSGNTFISVNLNTGVIQSFGGSVYLSSSITSVGNDWYRVTMTFTPPVVSTSLNLIIENPVGTAIFAGDGTSGIFIWGAQLVEGTSALDYFPTTDRQNVPRIDFRNADGTLSSCGRLLLEPQRTNLITYSEQFDNAAWIKTNLTVTANSNISPDGTQNADTIASNSAAEARLLQSKSATSSTVYSGTVFVKKDNNDSRFPEFYLRTESTAYNEIYVQLNTKTGASVIRSQTGTASKSVDSYGDYWRVNLTLTNTVDTSIILGIRPAATNIIGTYNPQIGSIITYGAQIEAGAYATSYIPTTTAAVTRLADTASKTGVSSLIGQTEGTLYAEINISTKTAGSNGNQVIDVSANADTKIFIRRQDGSSLFQVRLRVGGVNVVDRQLINIPAGVAKIAFGYKSGDNNIYVNGVSVLTGAGLTNTFTIVNLLNILDLGHLSGSTNSQIDDRIAQAALFPTRLTNAQLAQLTT